MDKYLTHTGSVLPLRRSNVDTDQIIPAVYLKRVTKSGFEDGLFGAWRSDPEFVLNKAEFAGATILVAGVDFGTGSSREHAPWALADYGFRAVIAPTFADIFFNNCFQNGMLPVKLDEADVEELFRRASAAEASGHPYRLTVDLVGCEIRDDAGFSRSFAVDPFRRTFLLEGLDNIGLSLRHVDSIAAWESAHGIAAN